MSSFRPEGSYYIGIVVSAIIYGNYLGVYCLSIYALLVNKNNARLHRKFYALFSSLQLLLNTFYFMKGVYANHIMWIVARNHPGALLTYYNIESLKTPFGLLASIAQIFAAVLNDCLLAYRCYVIFDYRLCIFILPITCTLSALALAMAAALLAFSPEWPALHLVLKMDALNAAAITLDTAVNIMITIMISIKILSVYQIRSTGKSTGLTLTLARKSTNVVAILVESAAPSAVLGTLASIGLFMDASSKASTFGFSTEVMLATWSMSIALLPQLIIYRVANGSAWTGRTRELMRRSELKE